MVLNSEKENQGSVQQAPSPGIIYQDLNGPGLLSRAMETVMTRWCDACYWKEKQYLFCTVQNPFAQIYDDKN